MTYDQRKALQKSMLFNYETTMRTDYQDPELPNWKRTEYKEKPTREQRRPYNLLKYLGTMSEYKQRIPFNALYQPKEILQTIPFTPQKVFEKIIDEKREEVQKTRPRLVMTPWVAIDDVKDQADREILMKAMYTPEMKEKMEEAVAKSVNIKAPLPDFPAPAISVFLPKWKPPKVPKEWRMDSVNWEKNQLRSSVDATDTFWMHPEHAPTRCSICEQTKIVNAHRRKLDRLECQKNTIF